MRSADERREMIRTVHGPFTLIFRIPRGPVSTETEMVSL